MHHKQKHSSLLPVFFNELQNWEPFNFDFENFFNFSKPELSGLSVYETDDQIVVEAAVPGIRPEEIQVSVEKGVLWIRGEKKEESSEKEKNVKYHMKAASSFSYRIPLPSRFEEGKTPEAVCKNGILKITFPKVSGTKTQQIKVKPE